MTRQANPVRARAFLIGSLLSVVVIFMSHYSMSIVHGSHLSIDHMPAGGIFLFLVLVLLLNPVLGLIKRTYELNSSELIIVYSMLLVVCSITTMGLGAQLIPIIAAPFYFATPENRWEELIQPHLVRWLHPEGEEPVRHFFEGLPSGESIPWTPWLTPLLAWFVFIFALYMVMLFLMVILRKQWVENEKITYPLVQLPVEMIKEDGRKSLLKPLFRNKIFWFGMLVPLVISSINALHSYFHFIPHIELAHRAEVFQRTMNLSFRLSFPIMGFAYLINQEVALGVWFFNLLYFVTRGIFNMTGIGAPEVVIGYGADEHIFRHVGTGAFVMFVVMGFWMGRAHLKDVFGKAFGRRPDVDDSQEIVSYRTAVWGTFAGMIVMIGFLMVTGMSLWVAVICLILIMVFFIGLTRIMAEAGIATMRSPSIASGQLISSLGSNTIGEQGVTATGLTMIYAGDIRTFPMSASAQALKLSGWIEHRRKGGMFLAVLIAILIGYFVSNWLVLRLGYTYGGVNLSTWFFISGPQVPYNHIRPHLLSPEGPSLFGWGARGAGAALMWLLMFMRYRFLWWPFHYLGFAIGSSRWIDHLWFSIFLVWLIKAVILKYGGARLFTQIRPFFLGLILGQYTAASLWFFIDLATGHMGNQVFWI